MVDDQPTRDTQGIAGEQARRVRAFLQSLAPADRYVFLAKLRGVSARVIQRELARPPYNTRMAVGAVDSHFLHIRRRLQEHLEQP
jgi:DNA-directed RNA polymerase specialized sigma24 family protein